MVALPIPHLSPETNDGRITVARGVKLAYVDRGTGPALVLIPGWTFTKEIFEKQIAALSAKYRVISYDPRGHGASTFTVEGNDYLTHAEDLKALLETLAVKNPVLVAWSAGAHTAWNYVKLVGVAAIAAFVCIDLSPRCLSNSPDAWVEGTLDEISAIHTVYLRDAKGQAEFVKSYAETTMVQRHLKPEELEWLIEQSLKCKPVVAAQLFANCMFADSTALAINTARNKPMLYYIAQHWSTVAVPFIRRLLPESRFVVFGGHMMFWEHPEAFNRVLDDFIQQKVLGNEPGPFPGR